MNGSGVEGKKPSSFSTSCSPSGKKKSRSRGETKGGQNLQHVSRNVFHYLQKEDPGKKNLGGRKKLKKRAKEGGSFSWQLLGGEDFKRQRAGGPPSRTLPWGGTVLEGKKLRSEEAK